MTEWMKEWMKEWIKGREIKKKCVRKKLNWDGGKKREESSEAEEKKIVANKMQEGSR